MRNRGKLVILVIIGLAVAAAGFSAWYRYRGQRRALDFWGTTSAVLIAEAPHVELLALGEPGPASAEAADGEQPRGVEFADLSWPVEASHDGQNARGIKNVRHALLLNTTFDDGAPSAEDPQWQYALSFNDQRNWATVLFDFDTAQAALTGGRSTIRLHPKASSELRDFFQEHLAAGPNVTQPGPAAGSHSPGTASTDESQPAAEAPSDPPSDAAPSDPPTANATPADSPRAQTPQADSK